MKDSKYSKELDIVVNSLFRKVDHKFALYSERNNLSGEQLDEHIELRDRVTLFLVNAIEWRPKSEVLELASTLDVSVCYNFVILKFFSDPEKTSFYKVDFYEDNITITSIKEKRIHLVDYYEG